MAGDVTMTTAEVLNEASLVRAFDELRRLKVQYAEAQLELNRLLREWEAAEARKNEVADQVRAARQVTPVKWRPRTV